MINWAGDCTGSYFDVLRGVMSIVDEHPQYDILLKKSVGMTDYTHILDQKSADGLVVVWPEKNDRRIQDIEKRRLPAVLIDYESALLDYVKFDNFASVTDIMEHLFSAGHRRIGCIIGPGRNFSALERHRAYRAALRKHKIPYLPELAIKNLAEFGNYVQDRGYLEMKQLLGRNITAVTCFDDDTALGVVRAIREEGLSVPEDIAVTGFDDIQPAAYSSPSLTTVKQPFFEMGRAAGGLLMNRLLGKAKARQRIVMPGTLIVRASTAKNVPVLK